MDELFGPVVGEFLKHGVLGVVTLVLGWFAWRKDREGRESDARHAQEVQALQSKHQQDLQSLHEKHSAEIKQILENNASRVEEMITTYHDLARDLDRTLNAAMDTVQGKE